MSRLENFRPFLCVLKGAVDVSIRYSVLAGFALLALPLYSQAPEPWRDPSSHTVTFVEVEKGVKLEVLDWGGTGRPLVLLAGGGNTAHVFDGLAPKLAANFHVYGVTRRGFGESGFTPPPWSPDRLADDVLAVLDGLKLNGAVLAGHSFAGAELSSIATRRPERIAGVIYLEAGYPYAFDNGKGPGLAAFESVRGPQPPPPQYPELAHFEALHQWYVTVNGFSLPAGELRQTWEATPEGRVGKRRGFPGSQLVALSLSAGLKKYSSISLPALVLFAHPHSQGTWVEANLNPAVQEAAKLYANALNAATEQQMKAWGSGAPKARVVAIPKAHHYLFLSHEADVLREMQAFLNSLSAAP